jgi:predicted nucleic acid-binding protein
VRYLDTSAFLKLLVTEAHSDALRAALHGTTPWSSTLLDVEAHRAALRLGLPPDRVDLALQSVSLVLPGPATFAIARSLAPGTLRTLDAIHLAAALELGEDLDEVVTYDGRMAAGCSEAEVEVLSPGLPPAWWTVDEPEAVIEP